MADLLISWAYTYALRKSKPDATMWAVLSPDACSNIEQPLHGHCAACAGHQLCRDPVSATSYCHNLDVDGPHCVVGAVVYGRESTCRVAVALARCVWVFADLSALCV